MCDGSVRGWLAGDWLVTGGRGRSGRARALHGKLLWRPRLGASTDSILVLLKFQFQFTNTST